MISVYDYIALNNTKNSINFLAKKGYTSKRISNESELVTKISDDLKNYAKKNNLATLSEIVCELHPDKELFEKIAQEGLKKKYSKLSANGKTQTTTTTTTTTVTDNMKYAVLAGLVTLVFLTFNKS